MNGFWDKLSDLLIVIVIIGSSIYLLKLLFQYSEKPPSAALSLLLAQALEKQRYSELQEHHGSNLLEELHLLEIKRARLELDIEAARPPEEQFALQQQLERYNEASNRLQGQITEQQAQDRSAAKSFVESVMKEITPAVQDMPQVIKSTFLLEFTTVVIVITSVLVLAVLGILTGEQLSPIVASIAGYVLGRTVGDVKNP
jgi:Fe2+ transport system protein B